MAADAGIADSTSARHAVESDAANLTNILAVHTVAPRVARMTFLSPERIATRLP